jgi:hypothetical protein
MVKDTNEDRRSHAHCNESNDLNHGQTHDIREVLHRSLSDLDLFYGLLLRSTLRILKRKGPND